MKIKHYGMIIAIVSVGSLKGASLMQMGSGTNGFLTNLQNSSGQNNQTLVWGLIIDTAGNGFQSGNYLPGFTITDTATRPEGVFLSTSGGVTDDRLFISSNLMTTGSTGDGSSGLAKPTNISINYSTDTASATGVNPLGGQAVALIWFDYTTKTGQTTTNGLKYGLLNLTSTYISPTPLITPADGGTFAFSTYFAGVDPVRTASITLGIPEPSSALLGAIGALALLRRRRN